MKRIVLIIASVGVCLVLLLAVRTKHQQRAILKAEYDRILTGFAGATEATASLSPPQSERVAVDSHKPSPELLQLRAQVTQLRNRKRELAQVTSENQRLQNQLANRGGSAPGGITLPPDYIKTSAARFTGYATPEATLESFLWAVQNRDTNSLLMAVDPEQSAQLEQAIRSKATIQDFFKEADALPGMRVIRKNQLSENEVELFVEVIPGVEPAPLRFKRIGAEWKMTTGF